MRKLGPNESEVTTYGDSPSTIFYPNRAMFREKMIQLRKSKKLTISQLSDKIRWGEDTLLGWETGAFLPGRDTAEQIARFYNVSVDYLTAPNMDPYSPIGETEQLDFFGGIVL